MFGLLTRGGAQMSAQDAVEKAKAGEITVIDVREMGEVKASGKAKGAIVAPLSLMPLHCDPKSPDFNKALDPKKPVALYCASGGRSAQGAMMLKRFGFEEVYNIGGLGHWYQAGGEIER